MAWRRDRDGRATEATEGGLKIAGESTSVCSDVACAASAAGGCQGAREKQDDENQKEILEKIRTLMIRIVSSLNREAFRGPWRDQWLKGTMLETVCKIESGSLKEMCRIVLKVELEMSWTALSDEFGKHRNRILDVWRKSSAATDVYRELVFFSHELNPKVLHDRCEFPSDIDLKTGKLEESTSRIKDEKELVRSSCVDQSCSAVQQGSQQQDLKSPSRFQENDVTSSEQSESKAEVKDSPESSSYLDSTLIWALYRKKEWWPAQVILLFSD